MEERDEFAGYLPKTPAMITNEAADHFRILVPNYEARNR